MKKNKDAKKGKKLFMKRENGLEVDNRFEFEESEIPTVADKPVNKPASKPHSSGVDPQQQAVADENTILIKRTVRSGQSIQFDGNVVVLGDVNPGSEIIASGNIVVMGALRGVVHAGATGNEEATVAAFKLQPTQLRIANHITRAPDGDYVTPEHPEIAKIRDGVVVIELYQMGQDRQIKIG
ncbi:MAG TPA: septum site-determining protein MinC [Desulfobacteria bacterium]|nr:septum site-determining protein MinC [Desulfobacteria bacterium]